MCCRTFCQQFTVRHCPYLKSFALAAAALDRGQPVPGQLKMATETKKWH